MDFDDLFNTLNDEVNKILETNVQEISSQMDIIDPNNLFLNSCESNKEFLRSPLLNSNNTNNNELSQRKIYENTLKELNPIVMDNLFQRKNPQDVSNGIKKMLQGCNEKSKFNEGKTNLKLSRQNNQFSQQQDFSYPFKQDYFSCNIL